MIEPLQAVLIRMLLNEIKKYAFFFFFVLNVFNMCFVMHFLLKITVSFIH